MELRFHTTETLPRLSWCLRIARHSHAVDVWHGSWVTTRRNFFAEGAWSGDYEDDGIDATILMGSGGRVHDGRLILATPSHTLEPLYAVRTSDALFVSNSIVFLFCKADDAPHPESLRYQVVLASAIRGLHAYPRHLPTRNGRRVRLYNCCNLVISQALDVVEQPKPAAPDFASFGDYRRFLAGHVAAIVANARDVRRPLTYEPIATLSSGYDSPACAVLARENGCREAVTFVRARGEDDGNNDDSGVPIAERLRMSVVALDRRDYLKEPGCPEAEFFGSPTAAMLVPLASRFEARVVFSGHGAAVWDRRRHRGCEHLVRPDPSGHSQGEFRLRVGWIHMVVPFVGCTSYRSIHRISQSAEMKPWSVGGAYDKPIPRRINESAGIDRTLFGRQKRAVAVVPKSEGGHQAWMTAEAYRDFRAFCAERWTPGLAVQHKVLETIRGLNEWHADVSRRIERRLARHWEIDVTLPSVIPRDLRLSRYGDTDESALLFHWSVVRLTDRYR